MVGVCPPGAARGGPPAVVVVAAVVDELSGRHRLVTGVVSMPERGDRRPRGPAARCRRPRARRRCPWSNRPPSRRTISSDGRRRAASSSTDEGSDTVAPGTGGASLAHELAGGQHRLACWCSCWSDHAVDEAVGRAAGRASSSSPAASRLTRRGGRAPRRAPGRGRPGPRPARGSGSVGSRPPGMLERVVEVVERRGRWRAGRRGPAAATAPRSCRCGPGPTPSATSAARSAPAGRPRAGRAAPRVRARPVELGERCGRSRIVGRRVRADGHRDGAHVPGAGVPATNDCRGTARRWRRQRSRRSSAGVRPRATQCSS